MSSANVPNAGSALALANPSALMEIFEAIPEASEMSEALKAALAKVFLKNDHSLLSDTELLNLMVHKCRKMGLDWESHPLQLIAVMGERGEMRQTWYATKEASHQLTLKHKLTVEILSRGQIGDCYEVLVKVTRPDGGSVTNLGVTALTDKSGQPFRGVNLANKIMTAVTKAIRRTVLAAVGTGVLAEDEYQELAAEGRAIAVRSPEEMAAAAAKLQARRQRVDEAERPPAPKRLPGPPRDRERPARTPSIKPPDPLDGPGLERWAQDWERAGVSGCVKQLYKFKGQNELGAWAEWPEEMIRAAAEELVHFIRSDLESRSVAKG